MDDHSLPGDAQVRTPTPSVPCVQCTYDLTGVPDEANCPECGFPVATTLEVSLYRQPLDVIQRTRSGIHWIAAAIIASVAAVAVGALFEISASGATVTDTGEAEFDVLRPIVAGGMYLLVNLIALVGFRKYATDMSESHDRRFDRPVVRKMIRMCAMFAVVLVILSTIVEAGVSRGLAQTFTNETGESALYYWSSIAMLILGIVSMLNSAFLYLGAAAHAATLAARGAKLKLERRAKLIYRLGIAAYAFMLFGAVVAMLGTLVPMEFAGAEMVFGVIAIGAGLIFLLLGIGWLVMLSQTLTMLSKARKRLLATTAQ